MPCRMSNDDDKTKMTIYSNCEIIHVRMFSLNVSPPATFVRSAITMLPCNHVMTVDISVHSCWHFAFSFHTFVS